VRENSTTFVVLKYDNMVALQENQIVITIATPTPGATLAAMQTGIIEAMQAAFVAVPEGNALELDSNATSGFYYLLELLKESLSTISQPSNN
jgi:hypothetical protein